MSQLTPNAKKVMELLLAGQADEAKRFVEKKYTQEIQELRAQLEEKERERTQLYSVIGLAKPSGGNGKAPTSHRENSVSLRKVAKNERSSVVKKIAAELANSTGGKVTPLDVVRAITKQGLDLGSTVPATVVGNVLFKDAKQWERVEKGIYSYIGTH
jgi:hypothetical protein